MAVRENADGRRNSAGKQEWYASQAAFLAVVQLVMAEGEEESITVIVRLVPPLIIFAAICLFCALLLHHTE
jgi:hypothetical protein